MSPRDTLALFAAERQAQTTAITRIRAWGNRTPGATIKRARLAYRTWEALARQVDKATKET